MPGRALRLAILGFALASPHAHAQKSPLVFVTKDGIPKWANETSRGKAEIHEFEFDSKKVIFALKNMSSNSNETEIWAFLYDEHLGWTEALRVQRLHNIKPIFIQSGDSVSILTSSSGKEILRISISQNQAASF